MHGTILITARTFRTVSELHIRIGDIRFAAYTAFMSVRGAGMNLGRFLLGRIRASAAVVFTPEGILSVDLIGIKHLTLNIAQIENKTVKCCGNDRISFGICSDKEHVNQIDTVNDAEPFHLTGDYEIDPYDIIGERHRKYYIDGHIDEICTESEPVIYGICLFKYGDIVITVNKTDKSEICKCSYDRKKDSAEDKFVIGIGSPGSFEDVSYGVTAKQHQKREKQTQNIISQHIRRDDDPCKKPPYLPVDYLIRVKNQIQKEIEFSDRYQITDGISHDKPECKVGNGVLT